MSSVTSMGTYSKYFVYGGAYYVWVNERTLLSSSLWIYIFFGGFGGGRGVGRGGGTAVEGWILLKEMTLYFGQPARAIMGLGSQSI